MINDLLQIQQDMASTHQREHRQKKDRGDVDRDVTIEWADPNDWIADRPKFEMYHREYTTEHWLQVFRSI